MPKRRVSAPGLSPSARRLALGEGKQLEAGDMGMTGKRAFRNTTNGWVGAITYGPRGEEKSIAVEPNGTVFLSDDEIQLTANAHSNADDSPFVPRPYEIHDAITDEIVEQGHRPTLLEVDLAEERPIPGRESEIPATEHRPIVERAPAPAEQIEKAGPPQVLTPQGTFSDGEQHGGTDH